jgi:hypothetical protein
MPLLDLNPMPPTRLDYPVIIEPLAAEDGGGFIAAVPDLPGCMSDGETPKEALTNVRDAIDRFRRHRMVWLQPNNVPR